METNNKKMKNKKLKGADISNIREMIHGSFDPDTDFNSVDTSKIYNACLPKINNTKGKVVFFGTSGEVKESDFKKLW